MEVVFKNILDVDAGLQREVLNWRNSEDVRRFMIHRHDITLDEHRNWLKRLSIEKTQQCWVVFIDEDSVGTAYITNIDWKSHRCEWGFYIGNPEYRGKGLAKLVLFKFLEKIFVELKLECLLTRVFLENIAALTLYRKFGFRELKQETVDDGRNLIVMEFTAKDWNTRKDALAAEAGIV